MLLVNGLQDQKIVVDTDRTNIKTIFPYPDKLLFGLALERNIRDVQLGPGMARLRQGFAVNLAGL